MQNFPTSFSYAALKEHFSSEFVQVVGHNAEKKDIHNLANTFCQLWKVLKNRELVFTRPQGKKWLEKRLVMSGVAGAEQPTQV